MMTAPSRPGTKAVREYWGSLPTSLPRPAIQALIRRCAWRLTGCVEATTSERVEVVVFDDDGPGGSPGTELGAMPVTVDNIPIFPDPTPVWNSFDISSLNIVVNDGSVYIGARWTPPSFFDRAFLSSDENGPG